MEKSEPVQKRFHHTLGSREDLQNAVLTFYYSGSLVAEPRIEQGSSFTPLDWMITDNSILGVKKLCTLTASFDPKIYDDLPTRLNKKGQEYRWMDFTVEMRISSGELCWSCKHKGVEAGSVKMVVGYDGVPSN